MMTDKELVLKTLRQYGINKGLEIQETSLEMPNEQLIDSQDFIPEFSQTRQYFNMLGRSIGFTCRTTAGRVVRLIQPYDSDIYTQEPEELSAHWGFVWSKQPRHAKPFIALSTSPYNVDECCIGIDGKVYKSKIPNNVWEPTSYPDGWTEIE